MAMIVRRKARSLVIILCLLSIVVYLTSANWIIELQTWENSEPEAETKNHEVVDTELLRKVIQPWRDDPLCKSYRIEFITNRSQPLMPLLSYPGSGNTWIRQLIEGVTGFFTGSVYEDETLAAKGLHGEMMPADCGCTIVQKTHDAFKEKAPKKTDFKNSGILILRNPYKAIMSLRHYLGNPHDHKNIADENRFRGPDWNSNVQWEMMNWLDLALAWIPKIKKGGVVHYEEFLFDRRLGIKKLVRLLNLKVDDGRLECVLRHEPTDFKRMSKLTFDPFTKWHRLMIDAAIGEVQETLKLHGFDPMPLHLYEYYNTSLPL